MTNGNSNARLTVENKVPVLRQKDIMTEKKATSPCRKLYFVIQLMYIDEENLITHHNSYWKMVQDILKAAPSSVGLIDQISECILANNYYRALKLTKKLIDYEQEVMNRV